MKQKAKKEKSNKNAAMTSAFEDEVSLTLLKAQSVLGAEDDDSDERNASGVEEDELETAINVAKAAVNDARHSEGEGEMSPPPGEEIEEETEYNEQGQTELEEEDDDEAPEDISLARGKVMAVEQQKREGEQIQR